MEKVRAAETGQAETFAIVTPSYAPDFDHCQLLVESVNQYVSPSVKHYLIVDRRDLELFSSLRSSRTQILLKQDILPWWIFQLQIFPKWWVSLRSLPLRGWIIQQLVKLSVNLVVPADTYIFLDSGAMFVRNYDPTSTLQDGKVPFFREQKEEVRLSWNTRWHQVAARLLGLPIEESYDTNYVGNNPIYWKRDNLTRLQRHIEGVTGQDWIVSVCRKPRMSEYVIYGMFVDNIIPGESGQYPTSMTQTLSYWQEKPMTEIELTEFKNGLGPTDFLVSFNEHARTSTAAIRRVFAQPDHS